MTKAQLERLIYLDSKESWTQDELTELSRLYKLFYRHICNMTVKLEIPMNYLMDLS